MAFNLSVRMIGQVLEREEQLNSNPLYGRFASDLHCSAGLTRSAAKRDQTRYKILISFVVKMSLQTKKKPIQQQFSIYSAFIEKDNTILLVPFKLHPVEHWSLIMMVMIISKKVNA